MQSHIFTGKRRGPTLVVLGAVHGNEPCGKTAIEEITSNIESCAVNLTAGTLVVVPCANELAFEKNVREVDANLNRVLGNPDPNTHEGRLALELRPTLEKADFLLDLHSFTAGGPAFVFAESDPATMAFAKAMPGNAIITGWEDNYRRVFPDQKEPGIGTTEYARRHACVSITFECGQHRDPNARHMGYRAIRAALAHTGLVDEPYNPSTAPQIEMKEVFIKEKPGRLHKPWKHLQDIKAGETYARYDDGSEQCAPAEGVVILPFPEADIGGVWGYFGVKKDR